MRKIKDFLMLFGFICIVCSVLIGLGALLAQAVIFISSLFPKEFQNYVFLGTLIVITSIISTILIKKLDNE